MRYPGWILFCLGLTSLLVNLGDHEIAALMWVDNWGVGVGNGIRVGLMVVGGLLVYVSWRRSHKAAPPAQEAPGKPLGDSP